MSMVSQSTFSKKFVSSRVEACVLRSSMNKILSVFLVLASFAAVTFAQDAPSSTPESKPSVATQSPHKIDHAAAYYHYALAHLYEEQVTAYGRSELANKAMEEYRLAIEADPSSEFLT